MVICYTYIFGVNNFNKLVESSLFELGIWYYIVCSYFGGVFCAYIDGVLIGSVSG